MKSILSTVRTIFRRGLPAGLLLLSVAVRADSVVHSVHNMSVSGPGTVKATTESDVCIFCHTVHRSNGQTPLWNHNMSGTNYIVYSSPTLKAVVGQPNGSSRLCLSCHDGTVALGSVNSQTAPIELAGGVSTMPAGPNNLGTDLSGDHPISFVYNAALVAQDSTLADPSTLTGKVKLDSTGQMQCDSCHNPHDDQFGNFLVMDNTGSALCLTCHNTPSWTVSAHAISPQILPATVAAKLSSSGSITTAGSLSKVRASGKTVATMGCASCHANHNAGSRQILLRFSSPEQNCLVCHNGDVAARNVAADFQKSSIHPITVNSQAHSPTEDPVNPITRHVVCADCHNPHAASALKTFKTGGSVTLTGLKGVSATGAVIPMVTRPYELCFRCHADSAARGPATVTRQFIQTNTRLQFSTANQSFHPVEMPGRNPNVPSLIVPWLITSQVACTDCHNSDSGPNAGGTGANGPHGSIYAPILERNLSTQDFQMESPQAYDLCYKCHSRISLLANQSFSTHRLHIVDQKTACTTCHDSHGVANNAHLINFNTTYVTPSSNGRIEYISTGTYKGVCSLTCHGKDHNNLAY